MRSGIEGLADDLAAHLELIGDSNPIYLRAVELLLELVCGPTAEQPIVERMARALRRRSFVASYERPLLLLAALRYDALVGDEKHPLATAFADEHPQLDKVTRAALASALAPERFTLWLTLATRKVQTNDVSRAVAWRWPAALAGGRPIALVDVGCSAGLALVADRLAAPWVDGSGRRLPVDGGKVVARIGYDSDPIDLFDANRPDQATWLRACIWPGDVARLRRLDSAIEAMTRARADATPPRIEQVRAVHVPARLRRLDRELEPDALIVVSQTFVREYIEAAEAVTYAAEMRALLAELRPGRAVWTQLELARDGKVPSSLLVAHCAGGSPLAIARCGHHPTTVAVDVAAAERLRASLVR